MTGEEQLIREARKPTVLHWFPGRMAGPKPGDSHLPDCPGCLIARLADALEARLEQDQLREAQPSVTGTEARRLFPLGPANDHEGSTARFVHALAHRLDVLEDALRSIAEPDDLVVANEGAFSVHAYRRCKRVAEWALAGGGGAA